MLNSTSKISVVIIAKNEEQNIRDCIHSCLQLSDDIVVVDCNSTDETVAISEAAGAKVILEEWQGYGHARNIGAAHCENNWILSIDADERLDAEMTGTLGNIDLKKDHLYGFRRLNHIGKTPIKHGEWNPDIKFRLYNREAASWNLDSVHEKIVGSPWTQESVLAGHILHYSYKDTTELRSKLEHYARLGAEQLAEKGLLPGLFVSLKPAFRFFKSYYLKGGFLDGNLGYKIAKANAYAVRAKYQHLKELTNKK